MTKALRILHSLGLTMFVGSILTFTVISTLTRSAGLGDLAFGRTAITAGTRALTLPGLALVILAGVWMTVREWGFGRHGWLTFKQAAMLAIVGNTFLFILPAAEDRLRLAADSLGRGHLLPEYPAAYLRESIPGGINVLLTLASLAAAVTRFRGRRTGPEVAVLSDTD